MTFEEWPAQSGVTASEMAARFKSSLRRGSGRAALLLEADPTNEELQSMLLSACKTNLTYDPQCEEERAPYLYRLITLTRRSDFFWTELSRCLDNFDQSSTENIAQIYGVLCLLASGQTDHDHHSLQEFLAREAIRKAEFEHVGHPCGEHLIRLDGLAAFLELIHLYHAELLDNFEAQSGWAYRTWVEALSVRDGVQSAAAALERARSSSPELDLLISLDVDTALVDRTLVKQPNDAVDYAAAKVGLDPKKGFSLFWIKSASADDLLAAASDLILETDAMKIRAYLRIFTARDFPLNPEPLFAIVKGANPRNAWQATKAIGRLHDHRIRDLAFELLDGLDTPSAIRLLRSNYQPGDFVAIERAIREADPLDDNGWHSVGLAVLDLIEAVAIPPIESRDILLSLYENIPCSLCREEVVRKLHDSDLAPRWMLKECAFDAEPETAEISKRSSG
ncbi:hypothetical protein [Methylosinus sp. C49]|uniref:hypothetical protein n=1 Tax=Methylosinus sp. C49 TaxID=2699395 RepID=UPI00137942A3|nr:hypothetical protein [Methylosinus sp. C49]